MSKLEQLRALGQRRFAKKVEAREVLAKAEAAAKDLSKPKKKRIPKGERLSAEFEKVATGADTVAEVVAIARRVTSAKDPEAELRTVAKEIGAKKAVAAKIEILEPSERDECVKPAYCECARCWEEKKPKKRGRPKKGFDKAAYNREYMRKRRGKAE